MDLAECRQPRHDIIKRVWDTFETLPYGRMKPGQHLVDRGYCLADPGRDLRRLLETREPVSVKVEGGRFLRWNGSTPEMPPTADQPGRRSTAATSHPRKTATIGWPGSRRLRTGGKTGAGVSGTCEARQLSSPGRGIRRSGCRRGR